MLITRLDAFKVLGGIILGGLVMFLLMREEKVDVDVPVDFDFTTPTITVQKDTVYLPTPVYIPGKKEVDSTYLDEYNKLKDSVAKAQLFNNAITINTYNEVIEDDILKIDLYTKTRGIMLEYKVGYKVKPQTYHIDTTLTVPIPRKTRFFLGGDVVLPTNPLEYKISIKPGALLLNKKESKGYRLSYDPLNKVTEAGIYFRF